MEPVKHESKDIMHALVIFARTCKMNEDVIKQITEKLFDEDLPLTIGHRTIETICSSLSVDIEHTIDCAANHKADPSCITIEVFGKSLEELKKTMNIVYSIDDVEAGSYVDVRHLGRSLLHQMDLV